MPQISRDDIVRLARLSSLQLDDEEADGLAVDISNILDYVRQLDELDTENVEPTYQVGELNNVWRDDEIVKDKVDRADLLALAPDAVDNQIKVPRVL